MIRRSLIKSPWLHDIGKSNLAAQSGPADWSRLQGKLRDQLAEHALPKFKDGSFKVFVEKVFEWEDIVEAHQLMESNKTKGKIICTIA